MQHMNELQHTGPAETRSKVQSRVLDQAVFLLHNDNPPHKSNLFVGPTFLPDLQPGTSAASLGKGVEEGREEHSNKLLEADPNITATAG